MLKYKIDVLKALKERGLSSYKLRKDKILGEQSIQELRRGIVSPARINWLCGILECQPGDLIEYIPDN